MTENRLEKNTDPTKLRGSVTKRSESVTGSGKQTEFNPKDKKERERELGKLRQQRHRQKQREREAQERFHKPAGAPHKRKNHLHNERMWASRNECVILEFAGEPTDWMVFLMKHKTKAEWIVTRRSFNVSTQEPEADRRVYDSEVSAKADYQILSQGRLPGEDWYAIENYYEKASQFIRQASQGQRPVPMMRLGFFFAILELRENGFEKFSGTKNISEAKKLLRGAQRRFVYELLGNREVPSKVGFFRTEYQNWLERLAQHSDTVSNLTKLAAVLADATDATSIFPGLFGELAGVRDIQTHLYQIVRSKYVQSATSVGHLRRTKHFSWIQIQDLNAILSYGTLPLVMFHRTLLGLTTGLRPEELERLASKKSFYLINGTHLNYKGQGIRDPKDFLISKTDQKVNVANLSNPMLSLVGRMLLKEEFECLWFPDNPFKKSSSFRNKHPAFKDYPERSLRATCATMLAYCDAVDSLEKGRATRDLAAQRLGHINTLMVTQVYAPQVPAHIPNPATFFSMEGVDFGDFWVTRFSTLWDAYLLKKFLEYHKIHRSPESYARLRAQVEAEARDYQNMMGHATEQKILRDQM